MYDEAKTPMKKRMDGYRNDGGTMEESMDVESLGLNDTAASKPSLDLNWSIDIYKRY